MSKAVLPEPATAVTAVIVTRTPGPRKPRSSEVNVDARMARSNVTRIVGGVFAADPLAGARTTCGAPAGVAVDTPIGNCAWYWKAALPAASVSLLPRKSA